MDQICAQFGITRQAHYQKQQRENQREVENEIVLEMVRQIRRKHPCLGVRKLLFKIQPMLAVEGLPIGRDRLFGLLREHDMLVKRPRAYRRTTTPGFWRTPNLLRGMTVARPNQVWVGDITYLEMEVGRFAYLFLLMDLFARFILGWHVGASLSAEGAVLSLQMALKKSSAWDEAPIHHSDHGIQYTSQGYMQLLINQGIQPSMGAVGNCYDNIFAERVIGTLKNEYYLNSRFVNQAQVEQAVDEAIWSYNNDRPHLALNFAIPIDVYYGGVHHIQPLLIPMEIDETH